jgi:hypothetical protein
VATVEGLLGGLEAGLLGGTGRHGEGL